MTRAVPWLAVTTALAAAAGVAFGTALVDGEPAPPPARAQPTPEPEPGVGLARGPARLPLPAGWTPLRRHSSLPGFEEATAVQAEHSTVALDLRPPEHPSLLPADVIAGFAAGPPVPRTTRLAARRVWGYELPEAGAGERAVALVLPTTAGVVTMACETGETDVRLGLRECATAMTALRLDGAAALPATPEAAARIVLPAAVARLDAERRAGRRSLAATRSPTRRKAAAVRIARAYGGAADGLRPLAARRTARLVATLDALDRKHRALGVASARRHARAARRAGARIVRGERRLRRQLRSLDRAPS